MRLTATGLSRSVSLAGRLSPDPWLLGLIVPQHALGGSCWVVTIACCCHARPVRWRVPRQGTLSLRGDCADRDSRRAATALCGGPFFLWLPGRAERAHGSVLVGGGAQRERADGRSNVRGAAATGWGTWRRQSAGRRDVRPHRPAQVGTGDEFVTVEEPLDLAGAIRSAEGDAIVVDCLTPGCRI